MNCDYSDTCDLHNNKCYDCIRCADEGNFQTENYGDYYTPILHTTANARFGFLRKILSQISKLTSYIRKRCTTFYLKENIWK